MIAGQNWQIEPPMTRDQEKALNYVIKCSIYSTCLGLLVPRSLV
jgi:hypothetical protein